MAKQRRADGLRDRDTPLRLVRQWERMAPGCYGELDRCRSGKDSGQMDWPDYCPLPINAAYTYLVCAQGLEDTDAAMLASELTACWIWRQHKVLYRFDLDLIAVLREQAEDMEDSTVLPAELLLHLPYPCVYVKAPGLLESADGFFAWVDYDTNHGSAELRIQWLMDDMSHSVAQVLHIGVGWTLRQCLDATTRRIAEALGSRPEDAAEVSAKDARIALSAIQLLLYLVSQDADVAEIPAPLRPARPRGKDGPLGLIQDKAVEIEGKDVGVRIGAAIRKARVRYAQRQATAGPGGTKRPHARRGHWHHYWTGPLGSPDRKLVLRWTAPTFIHAEDFGGDSVVLFPVKK